MSSAVSLTSCSSPYLVGSCFLFPLRAISGGRDETSILAEGEDRLVAELRLNDRCRRTHSGGTHSLMIPSAVQRIPPR